MKLLGIDTETGGLSDFVSLLTVGLIVFDDQFNELDSMELLVKPDDGEYIITAEALKINGIDLVKHDINAKTKKELKTPLYEFLRKHSNDGKDKLVPFGWNVEFDIKRVANDSMHESIISKKAWLKNVSYRCIDGAGLAQAAKLKGTLPKDVRGRLENMVKHFGLEFPGEAHTALADVRATALVTKELLKL